MAKSIVEIKNLKKIFGSFTAVNDISFDLGDGEILGFLGVNGAGKTTTIQMLLGVLQPTNGDIFYFGKNFQKHREAILEQVNFSSTYTNLPWYLTVRENLNWVSYLYDIKNRKGKIDELIGIFRLEEILNKSIGSLSAGQLTRVNLAKAFLNTPKVMLLDEPTASLDPDIADYIRKFILQQRGKNNISVLFTSHNMAEVEEVCDRVIFIDKGKIIADDTPDNLAKTIQISHVELSIADGLKRAVAYFEKHNISHRSPSKRFIIIDVKEKDIPTVLRDLMNDGVEYNEISIEKPTLEDYFLQVAKKHL